MSIKIKELPELERPYEKLETYGEKVLSDAELLAIIIKTGTREETAVQLAQKLLSQNNTTEENLKYLNTLTIEELMQIKGIGKVKAIQLKAVGEIAVRMFRTSNYKNKVIKKTHDLAKILMSDLNSQKEEIIKVAVLNNKNQIIKIADIAKGTTNIVNVPIKDILYEPIKSKATKFILIHNHPGDDIEPSEVDLIYTVKLYGAAKSLGLEMLDHIIIGKMRYVSVLKKSGIENKGKNKKDKN